MFFSQYFLSIGNESRFKVYLNIDLLFCGSEVRGKIKFYRSDIFLAVTGRPWESI